eukprot:TRINITY_DN314_c0_g1_i6.p1 TRINITY_DN314_c0_g1~~TRINITY_DN314_c0_g1_i6.p1  ORF type:complete len:156 (-),score=19.58 TRINITY_DN314_c0_g1_i6:595-1062(-)
MAARAPLRRELHTTERDNVDAANNKRKQPSARVPADPAVGGWAKFRFVQPPGIGVLGLCSLRAAQGKLALAMRAPCSPAAGSPTPVEGHVDIFGHSVSLGQFARYTRTQRAEFDLNEFFAERVHPCHLQETYIAGGRFFCTNFEDSKKKIFQTWE